MKVDVEKRELTSIIASLGKSSRYFEDNDDHRTSNWLLKIRHNLIEQGEEQDILENFFTEA